MTLVIPVVVFLLFQRFFTRGIVITGRREVSETPLPGRPDLDAEHPDRPTDVGVTERLLDDAGARGGPGDVLRPGPLGGGLPGDRALGSPTAGHLVGNHSHYHARMPLLTDAGTGRGHRGRRDRPSEAATGVDPRPWFRCPFGAGPTDPRVQAARHRGWATGTSAGTSGSRTGSRRRGAAVIEADVVAGTLAHGDGTVILLHAWPRRRARRCRAILGRLREAGATFVRIDRLDEVPAAPDWA